MRCIFALVSLAVLVLCSCIAHACETDADCVASCHAATAGTQSATDCNSTTCDRHYERCVCSGVAVLRQDGACDSIAASDPNATAVVSNRSCSSPEFKALLNIATTTGPELRLERSLAAMELSVDSPLRTMVKLALGDVFHHDAYDTMIADFTFKLLGTRAANNTDAALLHFDISFKFCSYDDATSGADIDPRDFEMRFVTLAQSYELFSLSTIRLLELRNLAAVTTTHSAKTLVSWLPTPTSLPVRAESSVRKNMQAIVVTVFVCVAMAIVSLLSMAVGVLCCKDCRKCAAMDVEVLDEVTIIPKGSNTVCSAPIARVIAAFDPTEELGEEYKDCIFLAVGDRVEIDIQHGPWFYGRVVSSSDSESGERVGYFPVSAVAWVGKTLPPWAEQSNITPSAGIDALRAAALSFSAFDCDVVEGQPVVFPDVTCLSSGLPGEADVADADLDGELLV